MPVQAFRERGATAVFSITYTIRDSKGETSTVTFYSSDSGLPDLGTLPNLVASLAQIVANLITGQIVGASLCFNFDDALAGITNNTIQPGSDVEEGALFLYEVQGGYKGRVRLPTFDEAFIDNDSREIDPVQAEVSVLINQLEGGVVTTDGAAAAVTVPMTDYRETDIVNVYDQYEKFNASRKRRR